MPTEPGLRERKKQKTRWAIQEHALRLFTEQGYDATTVDQIAAAAEVSPSTFFRYFKTKEDVVMQDEYDPLMARAFLAAPADLPPVAAFRYAMRQALDSVTPEEMEKVFERGKLQLTEPALRARGLENFLTTRTVIGEAVAQRMGRSTDDRAVRTFAGVIVGVLLTALLDWFDAGGEGTLYEYIDESLGYLEEGLRIGAGP
jgi:AcrR family transcriptional regulator